MSARYAALEFGFVAAVGFVAAGWFPRTFLTSLGAWAMNESRDHALSSPQFAFAIPLMPRAAAADWGRVQRNLCRTVDSALLAAEGHPASVYIACHDEPDLGELRRENLHVRSVPFPLPQEASVGMLDRTMKRRFIGAWLREDIEDQVFVMFLDADDLVHNDTVGHVLTHPAGSYVVESGYLMDIDRGFLLRRRTGFYNTCGSSFVCRFSRNELPASWDDLDAPYSLFGSGSQQGHTEYPRIATDLGKPPVRFPFPAAVYLVNHGENHWTTVSGRKRKLSRASDIVRPAVARRILQRNFKADDLADKIAGPLGVARAFVGALVRIVRGRLRTLRRRR